MELDVPAIISSLRNESTQEMRIRRSIISLAAVGLLDFTVISLYQTGVLKKIPDIHFPGFDSNAVNASEKAYRTGLPDGTSGATMYGVIMMLASYGGSWKTGRKRFLDYLLMGAVTANSLAGLQYLIHMAFKEKKVCMYCVTGAFLNFSMLRPAWRNLQLGSN